ncbi:TIGR03790 family protein [Opitutaceae bacterium TAV1]|nr:TIGR03790 family protein [Opitutaceae bacterium TAV1]
MPCLRMTFAAAVVVFVTAFALCCRPMPAAEDTDGRVVVILANSDVPDSVELARHYAEARKVPEANIIALPMPAKETITWRDFVDTIYKPLQTELVQRKWIDAITADEEDELGRVKYAISGHTIAALVVCRGVPLRVANNPAATAAGAAGGGGPFQANNAAVDSELALLAASGYRTAGFLANPLFNVKEPSSLQRAGVVITGRLDGPTPEAARALVDNALKAEHDGLIGRAYVDIGGPHKQGDQWLEETVKQLAPLGYDLAVDRARGTLPASARLDAPALYFGWYAGHINGPFLEKGFRFPPGAIALHIHSFSAATLRRPDAGWTGPFVARGVTATVGNVYEPYLQFTHQPHLLLEALLAGKPLGEAAFYSLAALSWQAILVGDPLYHPFAADVESQWQRRADLPPELVPYLVIRRMHLLAAAGKTDEALAVGQAQLRRDPALPLILTIGKMQLDAAKADAAGSAEKTEAAKRTLGVLSLFQSIRPVDAPMFAEGAALLQEAGETKAGYELFSRLPELPGLSKAVRTGLLKQGPAIAKKALDFTQAARWESEYKELTAPPPPKPPPPPRPDSAPAAVTAPKK